MKKSILLLVVLFSSNVFGQDEELFKTWYLHNWDVDLGEEMHIHTIDPPISPTLIINEDFSFSGEAACNTFTGQFEYEQEGENQGTLTVVSFTPSEEECDYQIHTDFESGYFSFLHPGETFTIDYDEENLFTWHFIAGMYFRNVPLSSEENSIKNFSLYPNPVIDELFIDANGIENAILHIYSISGKKLLISPFVSELDVSGFKSGVYFLEVSTPQGQKHLQRFIKK